ncbi:MAG TPA: hypothetical protein ENJ08_02325 [Gammaproteobacteria bacterium]|nr:hypothetical protein [Gammaproteobacteria bacterium]
MMNYYFYYTTNSPDTWERGTLEWGTRERGTGERGTREKGFSDGVKNTPSRIAPGSIRATTGKNGQPHIMAPRVPFARTFEAHLEVIRYTRFISSEVLSGFSCNIVKGNFEIYSCFEP